jgi:hypothetical protein
MRGEQKLDDEIDEHSAYELSGPDAAPVVYNPVLPIEFFGLHHRGRVPSLDLRAVAKNPRHRRLRRF